MFLKENASYSQERAPRTLSNYVTSIAYKSAPFVQHFFNFFLIFPNFYEAQLAGKLYTIRTETMYKVIYRAFAVAADLNHNLNRRHPTAVIQSKNPRFLFTHPAIADIANIQPTFRLINNAPRRKSDGLQRGCTPHRRASCRITYTMPAPYRMNGAAILSLRSHSLPNSSFFIKNIVYLPISGFLFSILQPLPSCINSNW